MNPLHHLFNATIAFLILSFTPTITASTHNIPTTLTNHTPTNHDSNHSSANVTIDNNRKAQKQSPQTNSTPYILIIANPTAHGLKSVASYLSSQQVSFNIIQTSPQHTQISCNDPQMLIRAHKLITQQLHIPVLVFIPAAVNNINTNKEIADLEQQLHIDTPALSTPASTTAKIRYLLRLHETNHHYLQHLLNQLQHHDLQHRLVRASTERVDIWFDDHSSLQSAYTLITANNDFNDYSMRRFDTCHMLSAKLKKSALHAAYPTNFASNTPTEKLTKAVAVNFSPKSDSATIHPETDLHDYNPTAYTVIADSMPIVRAKSTTPRVRTQSKLKTIPAGIAKQSSNTTTHHRKNNLKKIISSPARQRPAHKPKPRHHQQHMSRAKANPQQHLRITITTTKPRPVGKHRMQRHIDHNTKPQQSSTRARQQTAKKRVRFSLPKQHQQAHEKQAKQRKAKNITPHQSTKKIKSILKKHSAYPKTAAQKQRQTKAKKVHFAQPRHKKK